MHHQSRSFKWIMLKVTLIVLFIVLFSFAVMLLWNWLMPEIFGVKAVSYVQAVGLLILSKLLFSGLGRGHGSHGHHWHRKGEKYSGATVPENSSTITEK